jgi:hypothetical protein
MDVDHGNGGTSTGRVCPVGHEWQLKAEVMPRALPLLRSVVRKGVGSHMGVKHDTDSDTSVLQHHKFAYLGL